MSAAERVSGRHRWLPRVAAAFLLWLLLTLGARLLGGEPEIGLLALAVAATATTLWLCLDVLPLSGAAAWDRDDDDPSHPPGEDVRLAALHRMVGSHLEGRVADDTLQRQLMTLADQRLMATHGVSWRVDPERAAPLLGPELVALAQQSRPFPRMSLQRVDVLISRIEAL